MGLERGYSGSRTHYYAVSLQKSLSNHTFFQESGKHSQDKKRSHIKGLLVAATDCEPQYSIRLLQSKMRIGLAEKTVQMALGQAAVYSQKNSWPPKVQSPFEELRRQALASLHSGLPNSQGIPISHVVEWLAMEEILSEVEFLRMILPFGKRVFLSNERVWTESTRRLICLITQNEPNVRNVLLTELSIVAGENLQAHLQVVVLINEGIIESNGVNQERIFQEQRECNGDGGANVLVSHWTKLMDIFQLFIKTFVSIHSIFS